MTRIKVNEGELEKALEDLFRIAAGYYRRHGSGEVHLIGEIDEGEITGFRFSTFADKNSWVVGDHIITLYQTEMFDPLFHEDYDEWFENEDDFEGIGKYETWDEMRSEDPDGFFELEQKWREVWMEHNIDNLVENAMRYIKENDDRVEIVRGSCPPPLDMISAKEFARILGTTHQNVSKSGKRALNPKYRGSFPRPDATDERGRPLWLRSRAEEYARKRKEEESR